MNVKANVVKKSYVLIVVSDADNSETELRIVAESEEAAKLLIPEGFSLRKLVSETRVYN